jgi:hypothetical protein
VGYRAGEVCLPEDYDRTARIIGATLRDVDIAPQLQGADPHFCINTASWSDKIESDSTPTDPVRSPTQVGRYFFSKSGSEVRELAVALVFLKS